MKKQTVIKIIPKMIISVFLMCIILPIVPVSAATASSMSNLYSNPNQSSDTYKFKASDVINSNILTSVVGCTGVVNKVAHWMSMLVQSPAQKAKIAKDELDKVRSQLEAACASTKASAETAAGTTPVVNDLTSTVKTIFSKIKANVNSVLTTATKATSLGLKSSTGGKNSEQICVDQVKSIDPKMLDVMVQQAKDDAAKTFKEQCFDGIAITLAKNQLTAMAHSTMNWVNSGFGGNPFFVQNMKNMTYNLEKNVIGTGIDILLSPDNINPYATDFAKAKVANQGIISSSAKFLGGLQSDLSNFVTDPFSYYSDNALNKAAQTETVLQRAQETNNAFANNFMYGGWNGWLALTQREQNNPLGFNMLANQYLNTMQTQAVSDQKAEITQNNGFMSQKECILWDIYNNQGILQTNNDGTPQTRPSQLSKNDKCDPDGWKVITPGSLIRDKVTNYLNSPDRQLELVKTINDSLNALFSVLISKLQGGGLMSLSDSTANNTDWTDNMNTLSADSSTSVNDNNGAYNNFDLTRDLGNTYIHDPTTYIGTWNAKDNWTTTENKLNTNKKLYPTLNPEIYDNTGNITALNNVYYTVDTAGTTKLINEGYNNWQVGDRAFWNGSEWQNWKKGQQSPIAKRGVIQIQQDYVVAATAMLKVLPNIMPKLGELDYCIPGPNPSYKTNSADAQSAYQDWIGTIYTGPKDKADTSRLEWTIDRESSSSYKALSGIFDDNPNVWKTLTYSNAIAFFLNYFGDFTGTRWQGTNSYCYASNGKICAKFKEAEKIATFTIDYTNNNLFQNFYDVFDKMMNKIYFNNMTKQYLDTETSIGVDPNPAYVPMAQNGLDLTKDIMYYNDDTVQKIQDYTDGINQAKINIAKLQPIKDEVSGIIKAAQDSRDANLVKILNDEAQRTGGKVLTKAQYDAKYAGCLAEEDIQVFDADGIIGKDSKIKENCHDGIDNDLNGLTDAQDPACHVDGDLNKPLLP